MCDLKEELSKTQDMNAVQAAIIETFQAKEKSCMQEKKVCTQNEKQTLLPIPQSTILGNSHQEQQEQSSPHWGCASENASTRSEPVQDTLPPASLKETQDVEGNASQEDNAGSSKHGHESTAKPPLLSPHWGSDSNESSSSESVQDTNPLTNLRDVVRHPHLGDFPPFTLCPSDESRDETDRDGDHAFSEDTSLRNDIVCAMCAKVIEHRFVCYTCDFCDVQICGGCEYRYNLPEARKVRLSNESMALRDSL